MSKGGKKQAGRNIIIRREEVVEGGHHGGAWKVAYADFVTAMMAFFLLMWLLNATTADKRRGLADYFSPHNVLGRTASGFGAPFGGRTPNVDGDLATDRGLTEITYVKAMPMLDRDDTDGEQLPEPMTGPADTDQHGTEEKKPAVPATRPVQTATASTVPNAGRTDGTVESAAAERAAFAQAADQLRRAVADDPALAPFARQLTIDVTPAGLRIQIVDEDRQPMFTTGSAAPNDRARALLGRVAPVLMRLPEPVSVTGHTDATPYRGGDRSNWDLSADRANATRRLLMDAGLPDSRLHSVTGVADRDPLLPGDPMAAANRRIAITVLRTAPAPASAPLAPKPVAITPGVPTPVAPTPIAATPIAAAPGAH